MKPNFNSVTDAQIYYTNSGIFNWDWFEGFEEKYFIRFLYRYADGLKTESELVKEFLVMNGQNPEDYSL